MYAPLTTVVRIWQRVLSLVTIGQLQLTNDSGTVQTAQVDIGQANNPQVVDNVPVVFPFGFTSRAEGPCEVVTVSRAGDPSKALIIAANMRGVRLRGLPVGGSAMYDASGRWVKLTAEGIEIEAAGGPVTINNATQVIVNAQTVSITAAASALITAPTVTVDGNLVVTGEITGLTGAAPLSLSAIRSWGDAHEHPVPGVVAGSSTVTSDAPGTPL